MGMDIARYWKIIVDTLQDGLMVVDPRGKFWRPILPLKS